MENNREQVIKQFSPKFRILDPSVKKTFKGLRGSRSSGKSWAAIRQLVVISNKYHAFIVCGRAFWTNIRNSAYKLVVDTIEQFGWSELYIITDHYIQHKITGSRFIFVGMNTNPAGIKSMEGAHIVFVEEGEQISQEAWDLLIPTIIRKPGAQIWCVWNPLLPTTPVETVFDQNTNPDCVVEHINYLENPYNPPSLLEQAERDRVKDQAKYEWVWLGQFQPSDNTTWIGLQLATSAIDRGTPACPDKLVVAGLDLGFSHDRSVLVIRQGYRILHVQVWRGVTPQVLVNEVVGLMAKWGVDKLGMDCLGPGVPMVSYFNEIIGNKLVPINYGLAAEDEDMYVNLRSEAWGRIKDWLEFGHIPPGIDSEWITDLCNIRTGYDDRGRYSIEKKKLYIARGFPSTDLADALGISLCVGDKLQKGEKRTLTSIMGNRQGNDDWMSY